MLAEPGHVVDLLARRLQGVDHARRAVGFEQVRGEAAHRLLVVLGGDGGDLDEAGAAEALGAEPAVAEGELLLVVPAGRVGVGEGEGAGDRPFAGLGGQREDVGVGDVEAYGAGEFH